MNFESLANELILDIFEYFHTIDLFRIFSALNSRFDMLLFRYFQSYHLDFQSISKHNFDIICQQYLPFIPNRIISLRLSDDDETPTLPKLFLSLGFNLNQFIRLKSLTLNHLHSFDTVNQLIISCQSLSYLSLIKCCLHTNDKNIPSLLNHIWQLPKLIHCHLSDIFPVPNLISSIETISPTIRNLSLDAICCDLANLFTFTPNLQRFRTNMSSSYSNQQFEMLLPSMISLKIFHLNSISSLMFIHNMPNLRSLTIKSTNLYLNGYEWETIVRDYLPKIKFFRLKMEFIFPYQNLIKQQIHQFLETFQTPFWLEKHQWFVRCYCTIRNGLKIAVLHTLPYLFQDFHLIDEDYSRSTSPNEDNYSFITLKSTNEKFSQSNIRSLCIDLPFDDQLCERVSGLYSLKIRGTIDFAARSTTSFLSKTTSIRRLDFLEHTSQQCYNQEACIILANSLLGCQCEVLSIEVENRSDILYLFKTMSHLRMLIFRCEYDRWMDTDCEIALKNNELFIWLQNHFPSTCLFRRDSNLASSYMRLWIG